jgi:large subunit ribosomal protein L7/L12
MSEETNGSASSPQAEKKDASKGVEKLVDEIKKLKLTEVAELVSALEEEFGVSAAMPMMAAGAAPAAGAGEPVEEKTSFNVELTASGENKIGVIKAVREVMPELGLKEAKDLVDGAPKMVKENVKKEEAENMKKKLEEAGGKVTLK